MEHISKLIDIMALLRHPEKGCSWDLEQDFKSLIPYTIEEAYEVADAIERNDLEDLRLELGDLLLQVVFHSRIAQERGLFDFEQVSKSINEKLIRRHPHVFAGEKFSSDEERKQAWEQAKAKEREKKEKSGPPTVLDGIALNLPALVHCEKTLSRVADYGFDWPETEPVFEKVLEELDEVKDAWQSGNQPHIQEEIGDLLLVVVNLARHLKVNPEMALKEGTNKFTRRFQYIEQEVAKQGKALTQCPLHELDRIWDEAKTVLK